MEKKPVSLAPDFQLMAKAWDGGPYVPRSQVGKFSGGMLHPRTMANWDSLGVGPPRTRFKRKVFYPVDGLVKWLEQRHSGESGKEHAA